MIHRCDELGTVTWTGVTAFIRDVTVRESHTIWIAWVRLLQPQKLGNTSLRTEAFKIGPYSHARNAIAAVSSIPKWDGLKQTNHHDTLILDGHKALM